RGDGGRQAGAHLPEAGRRRAGGAGIRREGADRADDEGDARGGPSPPSRVTGGAPSDRRREPCVRRSRPRQRPDRRPADRDLPPTLMAGLGSQLGRLARHSAIYVLGGIVSPAPCVLLLPLYSNPRYLSAA